MSAASGVLGTLQITGGTPGAGKVLTSDANGNATWQDASSSSGADTTLRNLFLPPAPTGLSASPGNTQVSLSWTAPTVPFSQVPLTNYSYQVSSNGGSSWGTAVLTNSTSASATVTGLTNGTAYVFKVAGVNGVGTGSYSSASSSVTPNLDPYSSYVVLLLHMDGANGATTFTDSSTTPKSISRFGSAQISTAQSKFGGGSLFLNGSSYLSLPQSFDWNFSNGDFTVECWVYLLSQGRPEPEVGFNHFFSVVDQNTFGFKSWRDAYYLYTGTTDVSTEIGPVLNSWQHLALSKNGASIKIFINGIQKGSSAVSPSKVFGSNGVAFIGSGYTGEYFHGYIDELRITKGVARYTTGFTPSTAPFPNP